VSHGPWAEEADELIRGFAGGMLIGTPLLYTMEVWWVGSATPPDRVLLSLAVAFVLVFGLTLVDGFRHEEEAGPVSRSEGRSGPGAALFDSVVSFGIGIVSVTAILLLIREIDGETPLLDALGKIGYEAIPFCLGVAVASSILARGRDGNGDEEDEDASPSAQRAARARHRHPTLADLGATAIGAVFFAFNIAPTDEIRLLAAAATPPSLIAAIAVSLLISYAIVFEAGFGGETKRHHQEGVLQHPATETMVAYVIALVVAAFLLWFFGNLDFGEPWSVSLERILVLGLPAAIGGAAGRLVV